MPHCSFDVRHLILFLPMLVKSLKKFFHNKVKMGLMLAYTHTYIEKNNNKHRNFFRHSCTKNKL